MDHVALWMPVLILTIAEYLHELLENGDLASVAALCKLSRVVIVAVYVTVVLIIAVLRAEYRLTERAGEVINMVFAIESCDIRSSQSTSALVAEQIKSSEVIGLT